MRNEAHQRNDDERASADRRVQDTPRERVQPGARGEFSASVDGESQPQSERARNVNALLGTLDPMYN